MISKVDDCMVAWWENYGLLHDPFLLNKPLSKNDDQNLVESESYKKLVQYFPRENKPAGMIVLLYGCINLL